MPKAKIDTISKEKFIEIISQSNNIIEIAKKIGYSQTQDKKVLNRIYEKCKEYNIDLNIQEQNLYQKYCPNCKKNKELSSFYFSNGKYSPRCKECTKQLEKEKYKQIHAEIEKYKSFCKCAKCGDTRSYVLDFHHINPEEKDYTVSDNSHAKLNTLMKEIKKCIPLCANCHREFHYLERQQNITLDDFLKTKNGALE